MPKVDVFSFKCLDEQDNGFFASDEVYVKITKFDNNTSKEDTSPVYTGLDTNDVVYPELDHMSFGKGGGVAIGLYGSMVENFLVST
jgi:hypothetical protein